MTGILDSRDDFLRETADRILGLGGLWLKAGAGREGAGDVWQAGGKSWLVGHKREEAARSPVDTTLSLHDGRI